MSVRNMVVEWTGRRGNFVGFRSHTPCLAYHHSLFSNFCSDIIVIYVEIYDSERTFTPTLKKSRYCPVIAKARETRKK